MPRKRCWSRPRSWSSPAADLDGSTQRELGRPPADAWLTRLDAGAVRDPAPTARCSEPMSAITVRREGRGPPVLLVHGGATPRTTWSSLRPLAKRWTLVVAYRRGYAPSPPARHDFDVDADDLAPLLRERPHVVAHSYGALGA